MYNMPVFIYKKKIAAAFLAVFLSAAAQQVPLAAQQLAQGAAAETGVVSVEQANAAAAVPALPAYSTDIPEQLAGVWANTNRLVQFDAAADGASNTITLKLFYGWYYDRAAAPASEDSSTRDRNAASAPQAQHIPVQFRELCEPSAAGGAWELLLEYSGGKGTVPVPAARIGDGLYLDFLIRGSAYAAETAPQENGGMTGFWRAGGNASGILISPPIIAPEVSCYYYAAPDAVYRLRYWRTDAAYEQVQATFAADGNEYSVDKFLVIGDTVYTCVTGRATAIRHVERLESVPQAVVSDDGRLCSFAGPYLTYSQDQRSSAEQTADANSRKKPLPPPPVQPLHLDFHYDEIEALRRYTPGL